MKNTADTIVDFYDEHFFEGFVSPIDKIGFCNIGHWEGIPPHMEFAQVNLVETLLAFFANKQGTLLDAACGKGAASRFATKYFEPGKVTGINISRRQLEVCRTVAPHCHFKQMSATQLDFPDATFDNVLCIEAGFHFDTRFRFFDEAYRVLKPGGRLAMQDLLLKSNIGAHTELPTGMFPEANFVPDVDTYRQKLAAAGFRYVRVDDTTEVALEPFSQYLARHGETEFAAKGDYAILDNIGKPECIGLIFASCMAYAIK